MIKKIFFALLIVLLILAVWQHELIGYGIKQANGQLNVIWNAVEIGEVLVDSNFPDSLKQKIEVIQQARKFAVEELGLKDTENYTTLYDQKSETTLWNVSACQPYSFQAKKWWFPIVGEVPYKGFFDKERANLVGAELKEEGWDVRVRSVSGWSTLGWFKDPILSNMLNRSDGQLAELIIHELTHTTLFVKDSVTFNENLASFIGEQGARLFLKKHYGEDSREWIEYVEGEADNEKFVDHILIGTNKLDSLYQSYEKDNGQEEKENKKQTLINEICDKLDTIQFSNERYRKTFSTTKPNNAYFMSFLRYYSAGDALLQVWEDQYNSDLKRFISDYVDRYGS